MSIDIEKAFDHNACKKVVQLAKVTVLMTDARLDRYAEEQRLFIETDWDYAVIIRNMKKKYKNISHSLHKYRKEVIKTESEKFSEKYQKLKTSYFDTEKGYYDRMNAIQGEYNKYLHKLEQLKLILDQMKNNVQNSLNSPIAINKKKKHAETPELKELKRKLNNINEEIENYDNKEEELKKIEAEYKERVKTLKSKIKSVNDTSSTNMKESGKKFTQRLAKLKSDKELQIKKYQIVLEKKKTFVKDFQEKRSNVLSKMNSEMHTKKNKIVKQITSEKTKYEDKKNELIQKSKESKDRIKKEKKEMNESSSMLMNEISNKMKHKQHELKNQKIALNSITKEITNKFNQEISEKENIVKSVRKCTNDCFNEAKTQLQQMKHNFDDLDNNLAETKEKIKNQMNKEINEVKSGNLKMKNALENNLKKREELMKNDFNKVNENNSKITKTKEEIEKMEKEVEEENKKFAAALEKAKNGVEPKLEMQSKKLNQELSKKTEQNKANLAKKETETKNIFKKETDALKRDLATKVRDTKNSYIAKKQKILSEFVTPNEVDNESKKYGVKKTQFNSMFLFIKNQVDQSKKQAIAKVNDLESQIKDLLENINRLNSKRSKENVIKNLITMFSHEKEAMLKEVPKNAANPVEMMMYKFTESKIASSMDIINSELNLLLLKEENKLKKDEISKKIEVYKNLSLIEEAEERFEFELKGYQSVIDQTKEEFEHQKKMQKKKFNEQNDETIAITNDYEKKIKIIKDSAAESINKSKEEHKNNLQAMKNKNNVIKERIKKKIEQAKIEQEEIVLQFEEKSNEYIEKRISNNRESEDDIDTISDLSFEETDLIVKYLTPRAHNLQNYEEVKNEAEEKLIDIRDALERMIAFFTEHIDPVVTPNNSGRDSLHSTRANKSNLKVLPPLEKN